jgi:hypothetical protein
MDAPTQSRWFHVTPGRFVIGLLAVEGLLWLSDRFGWLGWHKGYAVLTGVASVGVAMVLLLGWFGVAAVFGRRFQFSIRTLLVMVVVVALPCSWLAVEMKKSREQKARVAAIEKVGGRIEYDEDFDYSYPDDVYHTHTTGDCIREGAGRPWPAWILRLLGKDFFANVVSVDLLFAGDGVENALTQVRGLRQLQQLTVCNIESGLDNLRELTHLRSLKCDCDLNDQMEGQLRELGGLTRLEFLLVGHISDNGLASLEGFQSLKGLCIRSSNYTDAGLRSIGRLRNLKDLILNEAGGAPVGVTDTGLQHLQALSRLEHLSLFCTQITDAGLAQLKPMPKLRWLDLGFTEITDAGLLTLEGFSQLEELDLHGSAVSSDGVKKLQKALPNCKIQR